MRPSPPDLPLTGAVHEGLRRLIDGPLTQPSAVRLAVQGRVQGALRHGFHSHDAWELFLPLRGPFRFEVAGQPEIEVPSGALLVVPPACLHMDITLLAQPQDLLLLVTTLPGRDASYGRLDIATLRSPPESLTLSATGLAAWQDLLGEAPAAVMDRVAAAWDAGPWGRERALGLLRAVVAAYAEVATRANQRPADAGEIRVSNALDYLETHYYQPGLSLATVAKAVGLSTSHLASLFRRVTGQSLHQTLLDIRLRRAEALLEQPGQTIKQIAAMTGWSNQLYFSTAFRRRYGRPPSALRP